VEFSALVSALRGLVVLLILSIGGDQPFLGRERGETDESSTDGGTGGCVAWVGKPPFGRLPSGKSKGIGLRAKPPALGSGATGKAGTGGRCVSLDVPTFRVADGERERRRKNGFFFFVDASER
jgi:hypothetical protein